jgi:hypothetical protein
VGEAPDRSPAEFVTVGDGERTFAVEVTLRGGPPVRVGGFTTADEASAWVRRQRSIAAGLARPKS